MKELENALKALADKNRLRLLKMLKKQDMCVCELQAVLKITQPSVSKHLKKLKQAGIIDSRQNGYWTDYYIKGNNKYASTVLEIIKKSLNNEEIIKNDLKEIKRMDRRKLCPTE